MNKNFSELFDKKAGHITPGLDRIYDAFNYLEKPSFSIPTILVAGTNGKGSTAGLIWSLLSAKGYKVGLYSSPHLCNFSERYQLSDRNLDDNYIYEVFLRIKAQLPETIYEQLSFFEIATLIAFSIFESESCDFQVIEVGLGGRLDATNILEPVLSIIVSLSVDHVEFLGSDLKGIAFEKMGIARTSKPLLWGASGEYMELSDCDEHIRSILPAHTELWDQSKESKLYDTSFLIDGQVYALPEALISAPYFIQRNFVLAFKSILKLEGNDVNYSDLVKKTFSPETKASVTLVGRSQSICVDYKGEKIDLYFDVGHNPNGIEEMTRTARRRGKTDLTVLVSILRDKDYEKVFDSLSANFKDIYVFSTNHPRAITKDMLCSSKQKKFYDNFFELLDHLLETTSQREFVVTGSVLVIGEIMQDLNIEPSRFSMDDIFPNN